MISQLHKGRSVVYVERMGNFSTPHKQYQWKLQTWKGLQFGNRLRLWNGATNSRRVETTPVVWAQWSTVHSVVKGQNCSETARTSQNGCLKLILWIHWITWFGMFTRNTIKAPNAGTTEFHSDIDMEMDRNANQWANPSNIEQPHSRMTSAKSN